LPDRQPPASPYAPRGRGAGRQDDERDLDFSSPFDSRDDRSLSRAFILAFLFRTFEAEAFVIRTGSRWPPRCLGQNKDLLCPKCGTL